MATDSESDAVAPRDSSAATGGGGGPERDDAPDADAVRFDREGVRAGFLTGIPVAIGVGGYGIAFGVLASQAGLSVAEAALMSATVLAGASQIIAVELWAHPIPVATIVATTFAVNLRYSLMGAALQPWFRRLSPAQIYGSLVMMADENWALTMRDLQSGSGRGAFLLGSGIALWLCWVGATILGVFAGETIGDPGRYGLDFVLAAVFVALAVDLWEGRSTLAPWLVALGVSVVTANVLPGRWYILLGGLAAAALEVVRRDG
ncbi:AzlC family ABC transporter permease [Haloterrigena alkaliphila]|uniref:AzlC family ABC transporter permease n=1 Tax=Haloterrigena alkaliphila TaxID=2816475 RepID=A0A8A2VAZ5_9EURY|nr:AzlC family ABC transporter permease [Haloterrigena alkaliphila]QSW97887.1 AzlC family ABC transporter permease [Haloterrigena alkaliphila]